MQRTYLNTHVTGRRILQFVLDVALINIAMQLVAVLVTWIHPTAHLMAQSDDGHMISRFVVDPHRITGWTSLLTCVVMLVWFVVVPARWCRTPAMALLGLRIVDVDRGRPALLQHLLRSVLLPFDLLAGGLLGLCVMAMSRHRQRIGDHVARTLVVDGRYL